MSTFFLQQGVCDWRGTRPQVEAPSISREPRIFIDDYVHKGRFSLVDGTRIENEVINEVEAPDWLEARYLLQPY